MRKLNVTVKIPQVADLKNAAHSTTKITAKPFKAATTSTKERYANHKARKTDKLPKPKTDTEREYIECTRELLALGPDVDPTFGMDIAMQHTHLSLKVAREAIAKKNKRNLERVQSMLNQIMDLQKAQLCPQEQADANMLQNILLSGGTIVNEGDGHSYRFDQSNETIVRF